MKDNTATDTIPNFQEQGALEEELPEDGHQSSPSCHNY